MGLFSDSIKLNVARMQRNIDNTVEKIAVELFTAVVDLSPTKPLADKAKGEFINNWYAGSNTVVTMHTSARSMTGAGSRGNIKWAQGHKTFNGKDGYMSLTNTTHYANRVEYDGWPSPSKVGPYAPVRNAFIRVAPKYK